MFGIHLPVDHFMHPYRRLAVPQRVALQRDYCGNKPVAIFRKGQMSAVVPQFTSLCVYEFAGSRVHGLSSVNILISQYPLSKAEHWQKKIFIAAAR